MASTTGVALSALVLGILRGEGCSSRSVASPPMLTLSNTLLITPLKACVAHAATAGQPTDSLSGPGPMRQALPNKRLKLAGAHK